MWLEFPDNSLPFVLAYLYLYFVDVTSNLQANLASNEFL